MRERLQAIRRIMTVREQMQRIAEWKLADLDRQIRDVAAAQAELERFIDRSHPIGGMLLGVVTSQRRRLAERAAHLKQAREFQAERVIEASRNFKLAETLEGKVDEEARRQRERKELAELIEQAVNRPGAQRA